MAKKTFVAVCYECETMRDPQLVDPSNMFDVMAVSIEIAADCWGHDEHGRLCPDCRELKGIPYNIGLELYPRDDELIEV